VSLGRTRRPAPPTDEKLLDAAWCDQFQDPQRLISCIPERVPVITRLEDDVTRCSDDLVAILEDSEPTFEDDTVFILPTVPMQWSSQYSWRHDVLDQSHRSAGVSTTSRASGTTSNAQWRIGRCVVARSHQNHERRTRPCSQARELSGVRGLAAPPVPLPSRGD
jgi:hypothetical protein